MTEQPAVPVRVVVCAANRFYEPEWDIYNIIIGARHHDQLMNNQITNLIELKNSCYPSEQGFIDQWGVFMNRSEALIVATEAGQINVRRPKGFPLDKLFSEDLY